VLVLSLDTSSPATSCALVECAAGDVRPFAQALHLPPAKAGDLLPEALAALCAEAGKTLAQVDALAVGIGPGSFTGLRVGLAAMKGLAYALKKPLAGASSLESLARAAAPRAGRTVVAALEARRGELFLAAFDERGARLRPDAVVQAAQLPGWLAGLADPLLVGPGARSNRAQLESLGMPATAFEAEGAPAWPSALELARLCAPGLDGAVYAQQDLFALAPDYLTPSEPEKALAEGRVGKLVPGGQV
jgi:tRNA threonylcarbamoyladenosine biosynthesis protein TsaB